MGYDKSLRSETYQTVSGVVAYDDPWTRRMLHLIINQAIYIPHLDHDLLCPMQCHVNDVTVNNLPKFLAANPTDQMHALTINDPNNPLPPVILLLILRGLTLLLNVRTVTIDESNSQDYPRLHLTSETLTWDPMTNLYEQQENAMMDYSGNIFCDAAVRGKVPTLIVNEHQLLTTDIADMMHNCNFHQVLTSRIVVSSVDASLSGQVRSRKTAPIDFMTLATWWMIAPDPAKMNVQLTMQQGVRTCLNPMLAQQYPANDPMLCYKQLPHTTFTDTLFAGAPSRSGNKCAQAYSTSFGWVARVHPMTRKGEAHEALSLLFYCDGVPLTMVFDSSKEKCQGDFKRKLCKADCHARQTEPYSPWQQAAEGCIRELKRGVSHKTVKTGSPRVLWDHCIELEGLIHSLTSNNIYMTNGKVPETIMTSSTVDISHICEFGWYDWVMFMDNVPMFPDIKLTLGQYLGPTTNVGSQPVCRSTLRHLNNKEIHCPIHQEMCRVFNESIAHYLGPNAMEQDFPAEDLTPDYDFYNNDHDLDPDHSNLEVTPEMGVNFLSADIFVPCGGTLVKGRVTSPKRDKDGNPIGLANANPVLDTREYTFTFNDGDETVLNANLIAEAMYAQCNPDGNQYILLDSIIDHRQLGTVIRPSDQKVVQPNGRT